MTARRIPLPCGMGAYGSPACINDEESFQEPVANSSTASSEGNKSLFLSLPPELRNQIFGYADIPKEARLRHCHSSSHHHNPPCDNLSCDSFIGLNTVCKQIRAEFRPLFYNGRIINIVIGDLAAFHQAFFSNMKVSEWPARRICIHSGNCKTLCVENYDLLPLLRSQTRYSGMKWEFHSASISLLDLCFALAKIINSGRWFILGNVKDKEYSEIRLYQANDSASCVLGWKVMMQTDEGKLNTQQRLSAAKTCRTLSMLGFAEVGGTKIYGDKEYMSVKVFVKNSQGKAIEMYIWDAKNTSLILLKGFLEIMQKFRNMQAEQMAN